VCQNLVPLVNIKIAGKWMFIPLKMVLIGIDPYPYGNFMFKFSNRASLASAPPPQRPMWPPWPRRSRNAAAAQLGPNGMDIIKKWWVEPWRTGSEPWYPSSIGFDQWMISDMHNLAGIQFQNVVNSFFSASFGGLTMTSQLPNTGTLTTNIRNAGNVHKVVHCTKQTLGC